MYSIDLKIFRRANKMTQQELADYLEVERSGLSAEISKLRNERVIECRKSTFTLL